MTKKNNETPSIEQLLNERQKISDRISSILIELTRFPNVQHLGIAATEAEVTAEGYLRNNGNGSVANLSETTRVAYQTYKADAENKRSTYLKMKNMEATLRVELNELNCKLVNIGRIASSDDVLLYQNKVVNLKYHIAELKQIIACEKDKVSQNSTESNILRDLHNEREFLMTDIFLGKSSDNSRLADIETQIAEENTRINDNKTINSSSEIVISGLNRELTTAEKELTTAQSALQTIYCDFLITEAEKEGAEFVKLSADLWEKFSRLIALGTMIKEHPAANGANIIPDLFRTFKIPGLNLKSCPDPVLYTFSQLDISAAIKSAKCEISSLGINTIL